MKEDRRKRKGKPPESRYQAFIRSGRKAVYVTLTLMEYALIESAAKEENRTVTGFLRHQALKACGHSSES